MKGLRSKSTHRTNKNVDLCRTVMTDRDLNSLKAAANQHNRNNDGSTKDPSVRTQCSKTQDGDTNQNMEDNKPKTTTKSLGNMTGFTAGYQNVQQ